MAISFQIPMLKVDYLVGMHLPIVKNNDIYRFFGTKTSFDYEWFCLFT